MGAGDADLAREDEGRHRADAEAPHLVLERRQYLRMRLSGPARHFMARGDEREDCGVADVLRLLEVGDKERVVHAGGLALVLREVDQLMRSARIGGARDPVEAEVDADAASLGGDARIELARAL